MVCDAFFLLRCKTGKQAVKMLFWNIIPSSDRENFRGDPNTSRLSFSVTMKDFMKWRMVFWCWVFFLVFFFLSLVGYKKVILGLFRGK